MARAVIGGLARLRPLVLAGVSMRALALALALCACVDVVPVKIDAAIVTDADRACSQDHACIPVADDFCGTTCVAALASSRDDIAARLVARQTANGASFRCANYAPDASCSVEAACVDGVCQLVAYHPYLLPR